jgi:hypothetical protein
MPWGVAAAAVSVGGGLLAGSKQSKDAKSLQKRAVFHSQPVETNLNIAGFGNIGISGGKEAQNITQSSNQFNELSNLFGQQARDAFGRAQTPQFDITQSGLGPQQIGQLQQGIQQQFGNVGEAIGRQSNFDADAFAATQFDRLNSLAARGEEIAANRVGGNLFARGRLGANDTRSGAAFEGLARAQGDNRTARAMQALQLAGSEADRRFQQNQLGIQNQFGLLNALGGQSRDAIQGFVGLQGFNTSLQQQELQNALGFGSAAGSILDPNFKALQLALNARANDQASRVSAATGAANASAPIALAGSNTTAQAIGNAAAGIGQIFEDRQS